MVASEIACESWPEQASSPMPDLAQEMFKCWQESPGHWAIASKPHACYGADMIQGLDGIWYATILVADKENVFTIPGTVLFGTMEPVTLHPVQRDYWKGKVASGQAQMMLWETITDDDRCQRDFITGGPLHCIVPLTGFLNRSDWQAEKNHKSKIDDDKPLI
jgi:hypothetical protein